MKALDKTGTTIGLDAGVDVDMKRFLSDSDGRHIRNPEFYGLSLET
jgi:hypothetical protein